MSSVGSITRKRGSKSSSEFTFTYTWSIQNYSYCTIFVEESWESPRFEVDFLGDKKLYLEVYPKGLDPGFMSIFLIEPPQVSCNVTFSVRRSNGHFEEVKGTISNADYIGHNKFLPLEEVEKTDGGYLVDDTLTVRCCIVKTNTNIPVSVKWNTHSKIRISKLDYTWILNDALPISNATKDITDFFVETPSLKINLSKRGNPDEDSIHFGIEISNRAEKIIFFICAIHLLDADGRVAHSAKGEHLFEPETTDNWTFPIISLHKFYLNKDVYLPKGKLTLRCELSFSSENDLETLEHRRIYDFEEEPEPVSNGHELWIENMQERLSDGKFSDFVIRTPQKQFPVHKAILSAHSEVFDAMFEREMKEKNSGEVEIDDLDDATVSKMLIFLYTNSIADLDSSSAQKLYFAADKYRIKPLQKYCSNQLVSGLDDSNVCDILDLADKHQDQELKSRAMKYIYAHTREIIRSDRWKELMDTNSPLTTEILQSIVCNKFL